MLSDNKIRNDICAMNNKDYSNTLLLYHILLKNQNGGDYIGWVKR